jgi:hypothetical protein
VPLPTCIPATYLLLQLALLLHLCQVLAYCGWDRKRRDGTELNGTAEQCEEIRNK